MTDEIEKLKAAFTNDPHVAPDEAAKVKATLAAMRAFEEKNSSAHQGNRTDKRLKGQGNKLVELLNLAKWRRSMKLSYVLTGGASFAVLAIAIANTGHLQQFIKPGGGDAVTETKVAANTPKKRPDRPAGKPDRMADAALRSPVAEADRIHAAPPPQRAVAPASSAVPSQLKAKRQMARKRVMAFEQAPGQPRLQIGRDKFTAVETSPLKLVSEHPVSTFSIDVDTASYAYMRAEINRGVLPTKNAVRVEELINYFPYAYPGPESKDAPFKTSVSVSATPWNTATRLVHIGIKGYNLPKVAKQKANLVFLLDTSGSMNAPNKLPLLKNSFKLLLSSLSPDDTVSIVAYAGSAGTVLEPTRVKNKRKILDALDRLSAGGSTAGGEGIRLAYQLAETNFDKNGVNRVMLATDGDFNVGIRNREELKNFVERKRESGVYLSVLGFGTGNYNDDLMQALAQNGNGNAAYIDSLSEARKVLVQEAASTLFTIASDVKIQMEFNPATVSQYRLIGYETRTLRREDFNNDKVDAGDIGAGHTVTAIYEITPTNAKSKLIDPLRYQQTAEGKKTKPAQAGANEYGFLKLRYKLPGQTKSRLIETPVHVPENPVAIANTSTDVRFSVAVAAFGQLLRGGKYTGTFGYDDVIALAKTARGDDEFGYRAEFINLVRLAKSAAALQPAGSQ